MVTKQRVKINGTVTVTTLRIYISNLLCCSLSIHRVTTTLYNLSYSCYGLEISQDATLATLVTF